MRHDLQGSLVKDKGERSSLKVKYEKVGGSFKHAEKQRLVIVQNGPIARRDESKYRSEGTNDGPERCERTNQRRGFVRRDRLLFF